VTNLGVQKQYLAGYVCGNVVIWCTYSRQKSDHWWCAKQSESY